MYEIDKHDYVVELEDVPQSSVGAPIPMILAGGLDVLLTYYLQDVPEGWDGKSIRSVGMDSKDEPVAMIKFKNIYAHMFGPPNDEAYTGHPLSERGLRPYGVFEVKDSSWLRKLEKMNSVHHAHEKDRFMENKNISFSRFTITLSSVLRKDSRLK